jgi:hypothetical protein
MQKYKHKVEGENLMINLIYVETDLFGYYLDEKEEKNWL